MQSGCGECGIYEDNPEVFIYLDHPYLEETINIKNSRKYRHTFTAEQHEKLLGKQVDAVAK